MRIGLLNTGHSYYIRKHITKNVASDFELKLLFLVVYDDNKVLIAILL